MTILLQAGLEENNEDAIKTLEIDLQFSKTNFESNVDGDSTIDYYIDFHQELCTNQKTIFDKDIICKVLNHPIQESPEEEEDDDDDDDGVAEMRKPLMEVEMLEKFILYSDFSEDILKSIHKLATL